MRVSMRIVLVIVCALCLWSSARLFVSRTPTFSFHVFVFGVHNYRNIYVYYTGVLIKDWVTGIQHNNNIIKHNTRVLLRRELWMCARPVLLQWVLCVCARVCTCVRRVKKVCITLFLLIFFLHNNNILCIV